MLTKYATLGTVVSWLMICPLFVASDAAVSSISSGPVTQEPATTEQEPEEAASEYYELRIYQINDYEKQGVVDSFLENALLPALGRQQIDRVGVFTDVKNVNDHSFFVLIPFRDLETFAGMNAALEADEEYQSALATISDLPLEDPLFTRIESRLMKAFDGIPTMEVPAVSTDKAADRIFELRLYESHTEAHAASKVRMFNEGEIQIMRDTELAPVFFGQTLIGADTPNLIYMLSAADEESHKAHWEAFLAHPEWNRIKVLPEFKDTVSKIRNWFLTPTDYSQL